MGAAKRVRAPTAALPQGLGSKDASPPGGSPSAGGSPSGSPPKSEPRSCLTSQLRKTRICAYHLKGTCRYGSDCAFAHSCTELQSIPDLRKTRLCQAFEQGGCYNKDCSFAHGEEELRTTNLFYKKSLCIWNAKGKCRSGDQCRFAHGTAELRAYRGGQESDGSGPSSPVPPTKQPMSTGGNRGPIVQEPLKVLPTGCLAPFPAEQHMQLVEPLVPPPPSMGIGEPFLTAALPPGLDGPMWGKSEAPRQWQWPQGMDMVPNPNPVLLGTMGFEELLANLHESVMSKDLNSKLEDLRRDSEGLLQKYNELKQVQAMSDPILPSAYVIPPPGLSFDEVRVGGAF